MYAIALMATYYNLMKTMDKKITPMVTIPLSEYEKMLDEISRKEVNMDTELVMENVRLSQEVDSLRDQLVGLASGRSELENKVRALNNQIESTQRYYRKFVWMIWTIAAVIIVLAILASLMGFK